MGRIWKLSRFALSALALSSGCGAPPDDKSDMQKRADLAQVPDLRMPDLAQPPLDPTAHPQLPLLVMHNGSVIAAPEVWTVVWPGDEAAGTYMNTVVGILLKSTTWSSTLGQYGVGPGTAKGVIVMPGPVPAHISGNEFDSFANQLAADPKHPQNKNTIYSFIVPVVTAVDGGCPQSGSGFLGYHYATSRKVPYAVNMNCDGNTDTVTVTLSHEISEASTHPFPNLDNTGWYADDSGQEIGDLCNELQTFVGDGKAMYAIQREWDNAAAMKNNVDPCAPAPKTPYFNAAMDHVNITTDMNNSGSAIAKIVFFSYGDVGAIHWSVGFQTSQGITVDPAKGSGLAGSTQVVTVKIDGNLFQGQSGALTLDVYSDHGGPNGSQGNAVWWAGVTAM